MDEDTPKSRQQIAFFFLPADVASLLGYILYCQRSLCFPVYYWRRISHKLSDCVHNSVLSNDN